MAVVMASINPYQPELLTEISRHAEHLQQAMSALEQHLHHIVEALHTNELRPNFEQTLTVNNQPQALSRNGRRHTMIWVASTVSCLLDNTTGNMAAVTLYAGWNPLDLIEGARILTATTSPTTFNCLYRCTDFEMSGALV